MTTKPREQSDAQSILIIDPLEAKFAELHGFHRVAVVEDVARFVGAREIVVVDALDRFRAEHGRLASFLWLEDPQQLRPIIRTDGVRCAVCRGLLKANEKTHCSLCCGPDIVIVADDLPDPRPWEFVDLRAPKPDTRVIVATVCEGEIDSISRHFMTKTSTIIVESPEAARWFKRGFESTPSLFSWKVYIENDVDSELELADEDAALITAVEKLFAVKRAEMQP